MMTKIEAIVQQSKFDAVKEALTALGIAGMTISDVRGHDRQKGHTEVFRGREYSVDLVPKIQIMIVVANEIAETAIEAIITTASTGKIEDGKIFVSKVDEVVRTRNEAWSLYNEVPACPASGFGRPRCANAKGSTQNSPPVWWKRQWPVGREDVKTLRARVPQPGGSEFVSLSDQTAFQPRVR